ncbi:MAG: cytochrome P450 [Chloroflexi bacterium]|nr:cytochrome P450 [Chloroflexota bacterium]
MSPTIRDLIRPVAIRGMLLRERLATGATFNPLDYAYQQDPVPFFARLRERDPVHRSQLLTGWVLSRYDDIDAVLRDHERFGSDGRKSPNGPEAGVYQLDEPSMLFRDPPDHTRLRAIVSKGFTRRSIEAWRLRTEQLVDQLLDEIGDVPRFEVMERFANRLPTLVIAEMLGVPADDYAQFRAWSDLVARTLEPTMTPAELQEAIVARNALHDYLAGIVDERRRSPREDLVSVLVAVEEGGDSMTTEELLTMLILLLVAGNETTTNLIGNGLLALLRHPDQLAWLRAHPDESEHAIEELLRFDGPVQVDGRTALANVTIGGKTIQFGEQVILLLGSANRDPRAFPDPDRLDLERGNKSHLSFGRGIHHCLGAPLARMEGQIALPRLIARFPNLRLDEPPPLFKDNVVLRGLSRLSVAV